MDTLFDFNPTLLRRNQNTLENSFDLVSHFGDLLKTVKFETDDPKKLMTLLELMQSVLNPGPVT